MVKCHPHDYIIKPRSRFPCSYHCPCFLSDTLTRLPESSNLRLPRRLNFLHIHRDRARASVDSTVCSLLHTRTVVSQPLKPSSPVKTSPSNSVCCPTYRPVSDRQLLRSIITAPNTR